MSDIFNNLAPFFEDCYRRLSVREYAKLLKISPPTASKILKNLCSENLLNKEEDRRFLFFWAKKENSIFVDLSRIYWKKKLNELLNHLEKQLLNPTIILFGSASKAEIKNDSDIDLAIFASKRSIDLTEFEKLIKRKIQLFFFESIKRVENKELLNNMLNGCLLKGRLKL